MDDHRVSPSRRAARRAVGLVALACTLAALGCTKSPLAWTLDFAPPLAMAGKPVAPGVASAGPAASPTATAVPTAGTSTVPASQAPGTAQPSPTASIVDSAEAIGPDDPLPAAGTTSDLAPAEQTAVEQALTGADVLTYLPADLIHDGGVVLFTHDGGTSIYRTLAIGDGTRRQTDAPSPPPPPPPGPAPRWGRDQTAKSGALVTLRKDCAGGDCAEGGRDVRATVRYQQKGTFAYDGMSGAGKRFGALFSRAMRFRPKPGGGYALLEVSPIGVTTNGGRMGLEILQVAVFDKSQVDRSGGGQPPVGELPKPILELERDDKMISPKDTPTITGGEITRIEVQVRNRVIGAPFVFVAPPGAAADKRVQFFDDGRGDDLQAGDGRFSGHFRMPNKKGLQHVLIDVVDPQSFLPNRPFRANTMGLDFKVTPQM